MPTQYEVIDINTKEVLPVIGMSFGDANEDGVYDVTARVRKADGTEEDLLFTNAGHEGNLIDEETSNDLYVIRQTGKQLTPNNDGVVTDEGKEVSISQNTRMGIDNGTVDPDKDIKDENSNGVNDADEK